MFGRKPKITEKSFADWFSWSVGMHIQNNWASISNGIYNLIPSDDNDFLEVSLVMWEFTIPLIAMEIQDLPSLLEEGQAGRIREYLVEFYSTDRYYSSARGTIEEYQKVWDESVRNNEPPQMAVANAFLLKLGYEDTHGFDPLVTEGVRQILVEFGSGLLKEAVGNYRKIVP